MPPGHGKSELVCRRFIAWALGRQPRLRIILVTHTATLALAHSRDIRRILNDDTYHAIFPEMRGYRAGAFLRDREDFWELSPGGYVRACGVGGAITGLRADIAIIDDPIKSREEAESPTFRDRIWEWFCSDLYTRLSKDGRIVICSTRWHRDDLVGRVLRQEAEKWTVLVFPAILENPTSGDQRQIGEALWPEFASKEVLEKIRAQDIKAFEALYQQNPAEAETVEFPDSYFGDWLWLDESRWPPPATYWVMAIDPSRGRQDRPGDYTAIVLVGVSQDRHLLYVDSDIAIRNPEETIRKALEFYEEYRPSWVVVETNQYHGLFERLFEKEAQKRVGIRISPWPITNVENKLMRIRRLHPFLAHREIRFRDTPHNRRLVDQLREFPIGRYDDGPDALEMAIRVILQSAAFIPERRTVNWEPPASVPL